MADRDDPAFIAAVEKYLAEKCDCDVARPDKTRQECTSCIVKLAALPSAIDLQDAQIVELRRIAVAVEGIRAELP